MIDHITCADCDLDATLANPLEQNDHGVWVHENDDEEHDARPTIREDDAEEQYEDVLNDAYEPVNICGYDYDAGRALRQLDPIAFREGMLDYFDSEGIEVN